MSGNIGTAASRKLLSAGVTQVPEVLHEQLLRGVEPTAEAQAAGKTAIDQAMQALREKHLAQKRSERN